MKRIAWIGTSVFFSLIIFTILFPEFTLAESQYSRTLYDGYVGIEPISIEDIKLRLEKFGCHSNEKTGVKCQYQEAIYNKENAVLIYPHGPCFGPCSFYLTTNKLAAVKDIPGKPQLKNFQKEVRQDLKDVGNFVEIKDGTWKMVKTTYPWDVLY